MSQQDYLGKLIEESRNIRSTGYLNFKENRQHYLASVYLVWRQGNRSSAKTKFNRRLDAMLTKQGVSMRNPKTSDSLARRIGFRKIIKATLGNKMLPMQSFLCHGLEIIHKRFRGKRVSHRNLVKFIQDRGGVKGLYYNY